MPFEKLSVRNRELNSEPFAIVNGTAVLPDRMIEDAIVHCKSGRIVAIQKASDGRLPKGIVIFDANGGYISPGFVDIHVHGGAGADFMDGTSQAVRNACLAHLRHGTTSIFPTTTTGSPGAILTMIEACRLVQTDPQSTIRGVHLYGPYFAPDKVGCHSQAGRREPVEREYKKYFAMKSFLKGLNGPAPRIVAIATCAAELPGARAFYRAAAAAKCLVTCGHSNANWTEMQQAFLAGMRHVDHFWCAMSSVSSVRQRFGTPMQGSMSEFVLMNDAMSTEVIADGYHLAPELLEFAYRMIGSKRLCLVTDCNRALDMPPGEYTFGSFQEGTRFISDGGVGRAPNGSLASSIAGMDHMVRIMKSQSSAPLWEVIRMASLTPAQRSGIDSVTGSLQRGKVADILILSRRLRVKRVFVAGVEVALNQAEDS